MSIPDPVAPPPARPPYLRPVLIGLVAVGGMVGTLGRAGLAEVLPHSSGEWPWSTLLVNLLGSFVLAVLLELLGRLRRGLVPLRLALGTGLLGGFTTYSSFAVETADLLRTGQSLLALLYVLVSLGGGLVLALVGLRLAGGRSR